MHSLAAQNKKTKTYAMLCAEPNICIIRTCHNALMLNLSGGSEIQLKLNWFRCIIIIAFAWLYSISICLFLLVARKRSCFRWKIATFETKRTELNEQTMNKITTAKLYKKLNEKLCIGNSTVQATNTASDSPAVDAMWLEWFVRIALRIRPIHCWEIWSARRWMQTVHFSCGRTNW